MPIELKFVRKTGDTEQSEHGPDLDFNFGGMCMSHKGSNVNVTAYINGQVVAQKEIKLEKEGDDETVFIFHRKDGRWELY